MAIRLILLLATILFLVLAMRKPAVDKVFLVLGIACFIGFEIGSFLYNKILGLIFIITLFSSLYLIWYCMNSDENSGRLNGCMFSTLFLTSVVLILQVIEIFVRIF